jgi:hypothetical protein
VTGRYCQHCGQENSEPGMTFWGLIQHFFYDITHFDGKYFDTLRLLFKRPGYLSKAFMAGKRASYVDPVRMYIFTSAFFFLLFYSFFFKLDESDMESGILSISEISDGLKMLDTTNNKYEFRNTFLILNNKDTLLDLTDRKALTRFRDSINQLLLHNKEADSLGRNTWKISLKRITEYSSKMEYDSLQHLLPAEKKDSWLSRLMVYRQITINEKYGGNLQKYIAGLLDRFLHSFPTLLFISLPLLALLLKLIYVRKKQYLFVYHGIYLFHLYIFTFLILIPFFLTYEVEQYFHWKIWSVFRTALMIWLLAYLYKSMRQFYEQSRSKTILKMMIFLFISLFMMLLVFAIYFAYMALKG